MKFQKKERCIVKIQAFLFTMVASASSLQRYNKLGPDYKQLVTGLSKPIFSNLILAMLREAREFVTAFIKIPSKVFKERPP